MPVNHWLRSGEEQTGNVSFCITHCTRVWSVVVRTRCRQRAGLTVSHSVPKFEVLHHFSMLESERTSSEVPQVVVVRDRLLELAKGRFTYCGVGIDRDLDASLRLSVVDGDADVRQSPCYTHSLENAYPFSILPSGASFLPPSSQCSTRGWTRGGRVYPERVGI